MMLGVESTNLRRRSREFQVPSVDEETQPEQRQQPAFGGQRFVIAALLSTVFISFVLFVRLQSNPSALLHHQPDPGHKAQEKSHSRTGYSLDPSKHNFREAQTWNYNWRISSGHIRPDGVLKRVYLINNGFPGPTLEARPGDRLIVKVENALPDDEGVSMHWHGLSMRGSNKMDGAVGITQDPIKSGATFIYDFTIDDSQHGTFWYHAHDGVQRADGLFGGLIVHEPANDPAAYGHDVKEHLLLIGDWYHRTATEALQLYSHPGAFGLETVPDSMLLNGVGAFNCADANPSRPLDCIGTQSDVLPILNLHPGKRNLLRIINVGAYAGFNLRVEDSLLTPVSVDAGHGVDGRASTSVGYIHPGERVVLLVERYATSNRNSTQLEVSFDEDAFKYRNPALTSRHMFPIEWRSGRPKQKKPQKTKAPEEAEEPEATKRPGTTGAPETAKKPEATESAEQTKNPEGSQEPNENEEPGIAKERERTQERGGAQEQEGTEEPEQGDQNKKPRLNLDHFDIQTVSSAKTQALVLPEQADELIVLYAVTQKLSRLNNQPFGFMNHTTWSPQAMPPKPLIELSRDEWDKNQFVPRLDYNSASPVWVDIVLNNLDEEGHPFHLHGYNFWVLSTYSSTYNWGSYNPYEDLEPPGGKYDIFGAVKKDTVYVPRRGYAVLRLRVDNPGIWMFHCHVLWHLGSGMAMAFEVAE